MENQLSFVCMLSLKQIALRRLAINLWNESDILALIEEFPNVFQEVSDASPRDYSAYSKDWREIIDSKVRDKISKLTLPKSLKKQILPIVTLIGLQIKTWKGYHERCLQLPGWERILEKYLVDPHVEFDEPTLAKLCWTSAGEIDYQKTAAELIRCEMVDIVKRYQLACLCCLEDYIPVLWKELPDEIKGKFYNEEDTSQVKVGNLPFCWPYILKGEQSKLDCITTKKYCGYPTTFHQHAFRCSADWGNKAATKYFFRKLTPKEKEDSIISTPVVSIFRCLSNASIADIFLPENLFDIVCYLLSQMDLEQQLEILKEYSHWVLLCFLYWPCQDLFLKNADLIWPFLTIGDYNFLLWQMSAYFRYSKYYYPKFFQEFFTHIPIKFRKQFVFLECRCDYFLSKFFYVKDTETVKVIFSNIDAVDRVRLVSANRMLNLFYKCILKGRIHKVKVFLREATLSKEDTEKLKETFLRFLRRYYRGQIQQSKRASTRFLRTLDEILVRDQRKRCLEDETLNEAPMNKKALLMD